MTILQSISQGTGFRIILASSFDTKLLIFQRFVRLLAYGFTTLVFVLFLSGLGHSEAAIGVFMALTMGGDVIISLVLTLFADRIGRRKTLAAGALGVVGCGVAYATFSNYWILLTASIIGIVTPTCHEIGPFKAIEESIICQLVDQKDRPRILAWYYMLGSVGLGVGTLFAGWIVDALHARHWDEISSYRAAFVIYGVLGVVKFISTFLMSAECEVQPKESKLEYEGNPLLREGHMEEVKTPNPRTVVQKVRSFVPTFEGESKVFVIKFALIFIIDQIGNGILSYSWIIYYFKKTFNLRDDMNGLLFSIMVVTGALSNIFAGSLTQRIGYVPAMLATHIPSTIAASLIPLPKHVLGAAGLLLIRSATVDMNQVPRQAFIAAALLPEERVTAMGVFQVVKTSGGAIGPVITGWLVDIDLFWAVFEVYSSLRIVYEILLAIFFLGYRTREEKAAANEEFVLSPIEIADSSDDEMMEEVRRQENRW